MKDKNVSASSFKFVLLTDVKSCYRVFYIFCVNSPVFKETSHGNQ